LEKKLNAYRGKTAMKKCLLLLLLLSLTAASSHAANWVLVAENASAQGYVDTDSIRINGQERRVRIWQEMTTVRGGVGGKTYQSAKGVAIYRCGEKKWGIVSVDYYSGEQGTGDVVFSENPDLPKLLDVTPGHVERIYNTVCSYRSQPVKSAVTGEKEGAATD
jgi:hypothetical protein